ncbi:RNA-binding domain-containing protein [Gymnopus androsaceus JB14]|uniref:RNA-binding domain-containing protein n=1 Tax=Gymnopus androsaceus JB14 TaxID=1447944 RepID=A0A6A4ILH0_9AGAR|nr:RNA-binding domain-containing protein [Gymnopus androsaceus JB14]
MLTEVVELFFSKWLLFSELLRRGRFVIFLSGKWRCREDIDFLGLAAGEVLFAEVLVTPMGVSKGCGIVEFANSEDAQRAVRELSEMTLLGRPVYIREDRENESRFGATPVPGKMGMAMAGQGFNAAPPPRPASHNQFSHTNPGNQLYVGNLPYQAGWQDLKDLFRTAGNIVRADINIGADGRPKGSGTVVFETSKDAQQAIGMYHGFDWYGRILEVREDRFAGLSGPGGRGGFRGGLRGGFRGGFGGRGGFRGGMRGGGFGGPGRDFSNRDLYADYSGPDQQGPGMRMDSYSAGGYNGGMGFHGHGGPAAFTEPEPSQQIMVRNLPWSTANEDLVELFETTGQVELAEILFEGTRSKGCGVVQFGQISEAETAIAKFQQYMYGGRPLDVRFNDRWHTFTPTAAKGGQVASAPAEA